MGRVAKICTDKQKILSLINSYFPATPHSSFAFSRTYGEGSYWKIGGLNVLSGLWKSILGENDILMAEHTKEIRNKVVDYRLVKSRFGEKKIVHSFTSGVKYSDNQQAFDFYKSIHDCSVSSICTEIENGNIDGAKYLKEQMKSDGRFF